MARGIIFWTHALRRTVFTLVLAIDNKDKSLQNPRSYISLSGDIFVPLSSERSRKKEKEKPKRLLCRNIYPSRRSAEPNTSDISNERNTPISVRGQNAQNDWWEELPNFHTLVLNHSQELPITAEESYKEKKKKKRRARNEKTAEVLDSQKQTVTMCKVAFHLRTTTQKLRLPSTCIKGLKRNTFFFQSLSNASDYHRQGHYLGQLNIYAKHFHVFYEYIKFSISLYFIYFRLTTSL